MLKVCDPYVNGYWFQVGKAYTVRETAFKDYVSDLRKRNHNGLTSYMAVQNISKTFPQLQVMASYVCCMLIITQFSTHLLNSRRKFYSFNVRLTILCCLAYTANDDNLIYVVETSGFEI